MLAAPSIAIDLPLKMLIWEDGEGKVWVSYNSLTYLQERHGVPTELLQNIAVVDSNHRVIRAEPSTRTTGGNVRALRRNRTMLNKKSASGTIVDRVHAVNLQTSKEIQHFGTIARLPIALEASICAGSVENLNQVLVDTKTLTDMYKKHHWQVSGPTFYQLHLLFDKHFKEQSDLVDALAERIQSLGGVSIAMAHDVAEMTLIPRVPRGREAVAVQISRLLHAHEIILKEARAMARQAAEAGDDGTNDLLVSDVIRTNEMQVWFLGEHVVDEPLVHADKQDDR